MCHGEPWGRARTHVHRCSTKGEAEQPYAAVGIKNRSGAASVSELIRSDFFGGTKVPPCAYRSEREQAEARTQARSKDDRGDSRGSPCGVPPRRRQPSVCCTAVTGQHTCPTGQIEPTMSAIRLWGLLRHHKRMPRRFFISPTVTKCHESAFFRCHD